MTRPNNSVTEVLTMKRPLAYDGEEDGPPWDEDEDENEDTEDGE